MEVLTIIGTITGFATLLVLVGGGFYWWGRLSIRVDHLARNVQTLQNDVQGLRDDMQALRDEVKAGQDALRDELKADMAALRDELLGEIRRSEQRILIALANHSHVAPDAGQPVFRFPPGMEVPEPTVPDEAPVEA